MAKIEHQEALDRVNKVVGDDEMLGMRQKIIETNRFVHVVGAQWEGHTFGGTDLRDRMDKYPRFEINKIAKEIRRISSEFRKNRINVEFKPADVYASQELSDKLNQRYRADYQESNGQFAITNAFDDAITGGYGAFRLCAEYEDELDPENENMLIRFKPVYDAASCLFFDPNSKEMDKCDAEWGVEVFTMPADTFKDEYGREGRSVNSIPYGRFEDFCMPNNVYIARYYCVKMEKDEIISYINPTTGEAAKYYGSDIEDIIDDLTEGGFEEVARRKVKRRRVYCGLMDGLDWLEKPEIIPFEYIPIIPVFGERYFIDGQERIKGHATNALDAQRLENLMVSMLADTATQGNESTPIVDVEQIAGLEKNWAARNKERPAYLPLRSLKNKAGDLIAPANVSGYTQPPQLNAGLVTLLQYTGQGIQELIGGAATGEMPANMATETVEAIYNRTDANSGVYIDNLAMALIYCGKVWLSGARMLYGNGRQLTFAGEDGQSSIGKMIGFIVDKKTGDKVPTNDLSVGKYTVVVDVGADFSTRRDQTVSKLTPVFQALMPDDPTRPVVLGTIIDNMQGEGIDDLRKYNRKQMVLSGVVEPRDDEERDILEEAQAEQDNQQPDANTLLAQAEMEKARVQEVKAQMDYQVEMAKLQLDAVRLQLEAHRTGAEVNLKNIQAFKTEAEAFSNVRTEKNESDV